MRSSQSSPASSPASSNDSWRGHGLELTQTVLLVVFAALACVSAIGCDRAVLIRESSPMRVGPNAKMTVYMLVDGTWTISSNRVVVPEGWYLVPPSFVEEEAKP